MNDRVTVTDHEGETYRIPAHMEEEFKELNEKCEDASFGDSVLDEFEDLFNKYCTT